MEDKEKKKPRGGLFGNGLKKEMTKIFNSFLTIGDKEEIKDEGSVMLERAMMDSSSSRQANGETPRDSRPSRTGSPPPGRSAERLSRKDSSADKQKRRDGEKEKQEMEKKNSDKDRRKQKYREGKSGEANEEETEVQKEARRREEAERRTERRRQRELDQAKQLENLNAEGCLKYLVEENSKGPLLYCMVDDPDFQLLKAVLPIRQDMENLSQSIVMAFDCSNSHKRLMKFVETIIDIELGESDQASGFLRSNTLSSKVIGAFSHAVGHAYLLEMLRDPVVRILEQTGSFEVDPDRLGPGEDLKENRERLLTAARDFLKSILDSAEFCPSTLRQLSEQVRKRASAKFDSSGENAVGVVFFLRFVCPVIVIPQKFGLVHKQTVLSAGHRRALMLVAKMLQNLANNVLFGAKEPFMEHFNSFIRKNYPVVLNFYDNICDVNKSASLARSVHLDVRLTELTLSDDEEEEKERQKNLSGKENLDISVQFRHKQVTSSPEIAQATSTIQDAVRGNIELVKTHLEASTPVFVMSTVRRLLRRRLARRRAERINSERTLAAAGGTIPGDKYSPSTSSSATYKTANSVPKSLDMSPSIKEGAPRTPQAHHHPRSAHPSPAQSPASRLKSGPEKSPTSLGSRSAYSTPAHSPANRPKTSSIEKSPNAGITQKSAKRRTHSASSSSAAHVSGRPEEGDHRGKRNSPGSSASSPRVGGGEDFSLLESTRDLVETAATKSLQELLDFGGKSTDSIPDTDSRRIGPSHGFEHSNRGSMVMTSRRGRRPEQRLISSIGADLSNRGSLMMAAPPEDSLHVNGVDLGDRDLTSSGRSFDRKLSDGKSQPNVFVQAFYSQMSRRGLTKLMGLVEGASMRGPDGRQVEQLNGWKFWKAHNEMVVSRFKDAEDGTVVVRGWGIIKASSRDVYHTVADVSVRPRWDPMTVSASVVESIDEMMSIVHYVLESPSPFMKDRDLLFLQCKEKDVTGRGSYAVFGQSINREDIVQNPNLIRGHVPLSGFYIHPAETNKAHTEIVFVLQTDPKQSLVPSWAGNFMKWKQAMCVEGVKTYVENRMGA